MSLNATTLSGAITSTQNSFGVASATGITAPQNQTGTGFTYLLIENELMFVTGVTGTVVTVLRGQGGTQAAAHAASCPVVAGNGGSLTTPSDFAGFLPAIGSFNVLPLQGFEGWGAPLTGATIQPTNAYHHFTGTTALVTITLPANFVEGGSVTLVFDGSAAGLTWTAAGNIGVAGTSTTAASAVTFVFDKGSGKWHPSRLA